MFGPEDILHTSFEVKVDVRSLHPTMSQEWSHAFFITNPTVQDAATTPQAPAALCINRRSAQLLGYTIHQVGTVVPQGIWPPGNNNTSDSQPARSAKAASLNMPIFFPGMDRVSLGLPLYVAIAEGDRAQLQGASSPAPIGHGSTTYIRMTVSILSKDRVPVSFTKMALDFNDQGPSASAQHDTPREVRRAPRRRSGQVHGSKPRSFFFL
jgi:hypothetical protein